MKVGETIRIDDIQYYIIEEGHDYYKLVCEQGRKIFVRHIEKDDLMVEMI